MDHSTSSEHPGPPEPRRLSPLRFWLHVAFVCALVVTGSLIFHLHLKRKFALDGPPAYSRITGNLEATERSGQTVHLSSLRGKVCVIAYVYTVCPHGCAAVLGRMQQLRREFAARDDLHFVSISVVPERDTAESLRAFAEGMGLKPSDNWWFLTGQQSALWSFMTDQLKLEPAKPIPPEQRLNPLDLFEHDLRVVLVDRRGNVRGYYSIFHPEPGIASLMAEKLRTDTRHVLQESPGAHIAPPPPPSSIP